MKKIIKIVAVVAGIMLLTASCSKHNRHSGGSTVVPTDLEVSPSPVKNGADLTITGQDLDVVTSIDFPNSPDAPFNLANGNISIRVPEKAQEGDILLRLPNKKKATVPFLLVKPSLTAYSTNRAYAGGVLSITGKDLDLVKTVSFIAAEGYDATVEVLSTETLINVTVPMAARTGPITLILKNDSTVEFPSINVTPAVFAYIVILPKQAYKPGDYFVVEIANADVLQSIEFNGKKVPYHLEGNTLTIIIPNDATANSRFKLISSNGEITYLLDIDTGGQQTA